MQIEDTNAVSNADEESQATEPTKRLTQQRSPIKRLEPTHQLASCIRKPRFESERDMQLENCHNIIA